MVEQDDSVAYALCMQRRVQPCQLSVIPSMYCSVLCESGAEADSPQAEAHEERE